MHKQAQKDLSDFKKSIKSDKNIESSFIMPTPEEYNRRINMILQEKKLNNDLWIEKTKPKKENIEETKKAIEPKAKIVPIKDKKNFESLQERLKDTIGTTSFERIKDIYETYSSYSGNPNTMEYHELQRFMKNYVLYNETITKVIVELLFKKKNPHKNYSINLNKNSRI